MTAYALEMKVATWAIKNYHHYLKGKKFIIITDYQPLVSNTNNNDQALNKLQQVLLDYEAENTYIDEKGILMKNLRIKFVDNPAYLPTSMICEVLIAGHSSLYAGHAGEDKTLERIKEHYTWKNMTTDIKQFVKHCQTCHLSKCIKQPSSPLKSLPIPDGPNQRVHIDLMVPLKSSANYSYILVATDMFTKFTVTAPLFNKKASTVAAALTEKWICRFSCPIAWVSDNGKEFINNVMTEMNNFMKISHLKTTPYHP